MVRGDQSKLLFIDSTVATHNDRVKLMLPSSAFTADAGDRIALTLQSFSMRRNFYSIHKYNSIFYVKVETDLVEIQIAHGSYDTFDKLATAIQTAMRTQLAANTLPAAVLAAVNAGAIAVIFESTGSRKLKFTIPMKAGQHAVDVSILAYNIKGAGPAGTSTLGIAQQTYEILGGKPIKTNSTAIDSLVVTSTAAENGGSYILHSKYPAGLTNNSALYMRLTTLETGNFSSSSYNPNQTATNLMSESNLFARIPFDSSSYTEQHEFVLYEDNGNDCFQSFPTRRNLEHLELQITDAHGRLLSENYPEQTEDDMLTFRCVIRFDLFKGRQSEEQRIDRLNPATHISTTGYVTPRTRYDLTPSCR